MYLQLELILVLGVLVAILAVILIFIRRQPPPPPEDTGARYTHGEREILNKLEEMRERLDKMIPPYGRVGYVPSSLEEFRELLGFSYVKLGGRELGERPHFLDIFENLDVDYLQASHKGVYIYIMRRGGKKLVATGSQYLDYLTFRFLAEFLDYI